MFETLQRLFQEGKITIAKLKLAVNKGWITTDEMQAILN